MTIKIGEKVKLLRRKNDVTQDRLAEYLGVTAQAISRWESETCYPDIEILPAIADFFGITVDELLCVDQTKKESKIKEYINEANNVQLQGDFDSAIRIYRRALREYPSSFQLQVELACAIGAIDNGVKISKELCEEVIDICTRILEDCTNDNIRLRAKAILCFVYCRHLDDRDKAMQIVEDLPKVYACQEVAMAEILGICLPSDKALEIIKSFIGNLLGLFNNPIGYKCDQSPAECVKVLISELQKLKF